MTKNPALGVSSRMARRQTIRNNISIIALRFYGVVATRLQACTGVCAGARAGLPAVRPNVSLLSANLLKAKKQAVYLLVNGLFEGTGCGGRI